MNLKYSHKRGRIFYGKSARATFIDPLTGKEMTIPIDGWSEPATAICRDCETEDLKVDMFLHAEARTEEEVIAGHARIKKFVLCKQCEENLGRIEMTSPLTSTTRAAIMHEIVRIPHVVKVHVDDGMGWMRVTITAATGAAAGPITARAHDVIKLVKPAGVSATITVVYAEP